MTLFHKLFAPLAPASLIVLLFATAPATLWAQEDQGPNLVSIRLVDVKPGSNAEWQAAIAEVAAAAEAAGWQFFHVYQRLRGPNLPTYSIITPDGASNDLPPLDIDQSVFDRLGHSQNGNDLMTVAFFPELGISTGSVAPSGEFMSVRVRTASPSNRQAYFDWHANELTPAAREGGVTDLRAGRVVVGGNTNIFIRFYYGDTVQSAPAGGGNIGQVMDERDFERMIAREASLIVADEMYVYRFREDLSFTAAGQ